MTNLRKLRQRPGLVEECAIYIEDLTTQERANVYYNIVDSTFLHVINKRIISFLPIVRILMQ
jgi:hypothetical protein